MVGNAQVFQCVCRGVSAIVTALTMNTLLAVRSTTAPQKSYAMVENLKVIAAIGTKNAKVMFAQRIQQTIKI